MEVRRTRKNERERNETNEESASNSQEHRADDGDVRFKVVSREDLNHIKVRKTRQNSHRGGRDTEHDATTKGRRTSAVSTSDSGIVVFRTTEQIAAAMTTQTPDGSMGQFH